MINIVGFVGAIGKPIPRGAAYIYNLNFFAGFIVSSLVYYLLCKYLPIPAVSDKWFEQKDAADRKFSVAYTEGEGYDEERSSGSDHGAYGKEVDAYGGPNERSTTVHERTTVGEEY